MTGLCAIIFGLCAIIFDYCTIIRHYFYDYFYDYFSDYVGLNAIVLSIISGCLHTENANVQTAILDPFMQE